MINHYTPAIAKRFEELRSLVGHTPLIGIRYRYKNQERIIYAKSEQYNFTGSIKDRMALYVLESAYKDGSLQTGDVIIEATSGNAGISLAAFGKALGHKVIIVMPAWASKERADMLSALGAELYFVTREEGGFAGCMRKCDELGKNIKNAFLPHQFDNHKNSEAHYYGTGPEIEQQLQSIGKTADAFLCGIGTGGTIMGTANYLQAKNPACQAHPIESQESRVISTGTSQGIHRVAGISDDWTPPIVDLNNLQHVYTVCDGDAIIMAQRLAKEFGMGVGTSSGFNFLGAVMYQNEYGNEKVAVTVFPDCHKKYLSTCLLQEEKNKAEFLNTDIELINFFGI